MTFRGYATNGTGGLEVWQFAVSDTLMLHLYPDGRAWSWSWNGSCWCRLDVTGSDVAKEAAAMLKQLPPTWTGPQNTGIHLPIVSREALGAAEWQGATAWG